MALGGVYVGTVDGSGPVLSVATVSGAAGGSPGTVISGISGQTIRVYRWLLTTTLSGASVSVSTTAVSGSPTSGNSANLSGALVIGASGGVPNMTLPFDGTPWFTGIPSGNFALSGTGPGAVQGLVYFTQTNL